MIEEIRNELFSLVSIKMEHANDIYSYASDYENTLYMSWPTHASIDQTIEFIKFTIDSYRTGNRYSWAIYHNIDNKIIGTGGILGYEEGKESVEIGYILSKYYWNNGLGTQIVKTLVEFTFSRLNVKEIKAYCDINNLASHRVLSKNHFIYNGVTKYKLIKRPEPVDSMEFILTQGIKEN